MSTSKSTYGQIDSWIDYDESMHACFPHHPFFWITFRSPSSTLGARGFPKHPWSILSDSWCRSLPCYLWIYLRCHVFKKTPQGPKAIFTPVQQVSTSDIWAHLYTANWVNCAWYLPTAIQKNPLELQYEHHVDCVPVEIYQQEVRIFDQRDYIPSQEHNIHHECRWSFSWTKRLFSSRFCLETRFGTRYPPGERIHIPPNGKKKQHRLHQLKSAGWDSGYTAPED